MATLLRVSHLPVVRPNLRRAEEPSVFTQIASHPMALGMAVGLINGVLAYQRDQFISLDVLAALAVPTMIAEGYLHYRATEGLSRAEKARVPSVPKLALLTGIGIAVGAAAFTRWSPSQRAWVESKLATAPSGVKLPSPFGPGIPAPMFA